MNIIKDDHTILLHLDDKENETIDYFLQTRGPNFLHEYFDHFMKTRVGTMKDELKEKLWKEHHG